MEQLDKSSKRQEMETQKETPAPSETERPPVSSPFSLKQLLPGLAIGVLLGIAGLLYYQNHLPDITKALHTVTLISFGVIVLSFLLVFVFRQFLTRKILGESSVGDFLNDAQAVGDAVTDQVAKRVLVNVPHETSERVRKVLPQIANWFIWGRLRNWWWNWILGVFIALGGLTGTILLINQNELLEAQNKKIDDQTGLLKAQNELVSRQMQLEEANRRSALIVLMSNIMDKVDREIESQQVGLSRTLKEQRKYSLSQSLIGQIAALSHSFKPYRYMEGDSLIERPLSPERGQLLITLTLLPLDTSTFRKIFQSSNFAYANLRGAKLTGANLNGANLENANLSGADLSDSELIATSLDWADLSYSTLIDANLHEASLMEANLYFTNLISADLTGAYFSGAEYRERDDFSKEFLNGANLEKANLSGADLSGAFLNHVNFRHANLTNVDLTDADLSDTNLSMADFTNADFTNADLSWASLREANLSGAKNLLYSQLIKVFYLYKVSNLHDSLHNNIQKQMPELFEKKEYLEDLEQELDKGY